VEHDHIKSFVFRQQAIRGLFAVPHDFGGISLLLQIEAQPLRQMSLILDHQNAAQAVHLGSSRMMVVPWPTPSLSANTLPPCFFAIAFTINNPRPVPLTCA